MYTYDELSEKLKNIKEPETEDGFIKAQAKSSKRLGISVTQACPLKCAHCSVNATPDKNQTTLNAFAGQKIASQIEKLAENHIKSIDFTGGEPVLAADFVTMVSAVAKSSKITTGMVSSAYWAKNKKMAFRTLNKFKNIDTWDISTDIYHLPFVSIENVELAFNMLADIGKKPLIRIAHHEPLQYEEAVLIDKVHKFANENISFQPIGPVGRADSLFHFMKTDETEYDRSGCPSTGPLILPNGDVVSCCGPLSHMELDNPFKLGNVFIEPLTNIVEKWRVNPLLQTMRLWGSAPLITWLKEAGFKDKWYHSHKVCHQCVELMKNPELLKYVLNKSSKLMHKIKLSHALDKYFKEPWMESTTMIESKKFMQDNSDLFASSTV